MAAVGDAIAYWRRRGVCRHQSAIGRHGPAWCAEQQGLATGQLACTEHTGDCPAVFAVAEAGFDATDRALHGEAHTDPPR